MTAFLPSRAYRRSSARRDLKASGFPPLVEVTATSRAAKPLLTRYARAYLHTGTPMHARAS